MDGWVVVGTKLDSKQLEKDLKNAERILQQYEKEAERLTKSKAKAEVDLSAYEEQKQLIKQTTDDALQYAQTEQEVTRQLEIEKTQLEELNTKYSKQLNNLDDINKKIEENAKNQGLVTNEIEETNKKLRQAKGISSIKDVMDDVNKSTSNAIKKVGKWALAIFGVRSAYMFVRKSASTLAQYNEQIAADLEYMQFALASMLQPLIEGMINLAYKLLTYVNYIAKAWFGVDLFANASAKAMEKGSKSAEKMKKSLAGFDEMNVLNDNGTTGAMGASPSMDLSAPEDVPIPSWIQWIADNKDIVIAGLLGIAGGLTTVSFGLTAIKGLGIGLTLAGIIMLISSVISYLNDPSWDNFGKTISSIGVILVGFGIAIGSIPLAVAGAGVIIIGLIVSNWEKIKSKLEDAIKWIDNNMDSIVKKFGIVGSVIATIFQGAISYIISFFEDFYSGIKKIIDGIIKIFKGDFKGGLTSIFSGLKSILLAPINALIAGVNTLIKGLNKIKFDVPDWVPGIGGKKLGFNIPQIPKLAVGGVVNMPGRGVPVGGAIAGEDGREGVIPLTDSQAMETLGQAIGRYITINANITNTMNGRIISRELQKVNNNSDFAFNR